MTSEEAILAVIEALETLNVPYMLVDSFSSNFYGIARSTGDADFVIQLDPESLPRLASQLGPAFRLDPQMSFETATLTWRHALEVIGIPFQIELFHLSEEPHDRERFRRRKKVKVLNREIYLPTAEDVIITKVHWLRSLGRTKDREDVRAVIAIQGQTIDWAYINEWCDRHGTRALLDSLRASLPAR